MTKSNFTIEQKIIKTLKEASYDLKLLKDDFFVIGSSALILSGISLYTEDIDMLLSERDAQLLKDIWAKRKKIIDDSPTEKFRSNFSRYHFSEIDIEIAGDLEVWHQNKWEKISVNNFNQLEINDLTIKIPTLEEQKRILLLFGREKDLRKIVLIDKILRKKEKLHLKTKKF